MRSFRGPGRVNLIGEHTDYSGGLVLPAAIDRFVTVSGEAAAGVVRLRSERFGETAEVALDGPAPSAGFGRYVAAVVAELAALGRPPVGFAGTIASDLPAGAGLASSAALEVTVAAALCAVAEFELEPLELAEACRRAEHRAVGVPCGIMDQAAAVLGRAGHAVLLDCGSLKHRLVPLPDDLALVVIDSGVARRLEQSGYAVRREEVAAALAEDESADPVLARRRHHVETENARVPAVVEALETSDRGALGRLFAEGHASLRDDCEVSTPELDRLVELALEAGAVAARMTGGGFGGSILALADADRAEKLGRTVVAAYGPRGTAYICRTADGVSA